ncbi:MAG: 6-pyruvoyl-tetrahydropterin synthase-related protein, partial [Anaerolineae bacterium]
MGAPRTQTKLFFWLMAVLLPAFAVYVALWEPVEEHSYDAAVFHVHRGVVYSAARAEGDLYPRWVQPINAGLGGPLFSSYSPLSYTAMDVLQALGFSAPVAWRLLVALALVLASTGVCALALELSRDAGGALAAAAVYAYSFPFLRELFERGSPQGFALGLYPWVLVAMLRFARRPNGVGLGLAALAWASVILTHNLSAAFLVVVFGAVAAVFALRKDWRAVAATALAVACGLLLAGFYLAPSLLERRYVRLENAIAPDYARVAENAIGVGDLLGLPSAYDMGLDNNLIGETAGPLQGIIAVAGLAAGAVLWVRRRSWKAVPLLVFGLLSLTVMWLQTASADALWRAVPALAYVQARSRLLGLSILSSASIVAFLVLEPAGRWRTLLSLGFVIASVLMALPVLYPELQHRYGRFEPGIEAEDVTAASLAAGVPGLTAFNEFLPVWRYQPFTDEEAQRVKESLFADLPEGASVVSEERGMSWARAQLD